MKPAVEGLCYILFHDAGGVYLDTHKNIDHWSLINPDVYLSARTFITKQGAIEYAKEMLHDATKYSKNELGRNYWSECRPIEVKASAGDRASEMDCRDRLLPGWL